MPTNEEWLARALQATRQSKSIVFDSADVTTDLVALANSGGGAMVFSQPIDVTPIQADVPFERFPGEKTVLVVQPAASPIVLGGVVYVRRGAKSVPATSEDLRKFIERRLQGARRQWLAGVRRVVAGEPPEVRVTVEPSAKGVRIVDDPHAPAFRQIDPNQTHPFRQKDVIAEVRKVLPPGETFTSRDAVAVRRQHNIDANPAFFYRPKFASPQYSREYVDWLRARIAEDPSFLPEARRHYAEEILTAAASR